MLHVDYCIEATVYRCAKKKKKRSAPGIFCFMLFVIYCLFFSLCTYDISLWLPGYLQTQLYTAHARTLGSFNEHGIYFYHMIVVCFGWIRSCRVWNTLRSPDWYFTVEHTFWGQTNTAAFWIELQTHQNNLLKKYIRSTPYIVIILFFQIVKNKYSEYSAYLLLKKHIYCKFYLFAYSTMIRLYFIYFLPTKKHTHTYE